MSKAAIVTSLLLGALAAAAACGRSRDEAPPATSARVAAPSATPPARPSAPPAGPTGTVRGVVRLTGTPPEMPALNRGTDAFCGAKPMHAETVLTGEGGALVNAVVRVAPGDVPSFTPAAPVVVEQTDCMYRPRVQAGVVGQTLEIRNADPTFHNVNARRLEWGKRQDLDTLFNKGQPRGSAPVTAALAADVDVVKLKCDSHGWMQGFVVVSDNPYAATSGADGTFVLAGVPAGPRKLEVWHEYYGVKRLDVTVAPGEQDVVVTYDATTDRPASAGAPPAPASVPAP